MQKTTGRALITGASSGIGRDLAREFARSGFDCVLVARRLDRLEELAHELVESHGVEADVEALDLVTDGAIASLHERLRTRGRDVDLLVNDAGRGVHGDFVDRDLDELLGMVRLNVLALTELTHRFGRDMAARGHGHVLNVASTGGLTPVPSYAVYAATKAYVVSLSEALALELAPRGVKITCALPGPTWTEFFDVSGQTPTLYNRLTGMSSEQVARECVRAVLGGRRTIVVGRGNRISMAIARWLPRRTMARISGAMMRND